MAIENQPDDIKALFESMMDKDYGFYDYTGTGDYIEGALGGYQYDAITSAQAAQWLKAKGRPMTDRKQPWYLAVNLVNPHDVMWLNTDLPGQPVQAKDAQLTSRRAPARHALPAGMEQRSPAEHLAATARRAGPRGRAPHLSRGQRLPDRPDPQRRMARAQAAELLLQLPSATPTSRSCRSSTSSTGSASPTRPS